MMLFHNVVFRCCWGVSIYLLLLLWFGIASAEGILKPQDSETRTVVSLDGLWNFRAGSQSDQNQGFDEQWYSKPLQQSGKSILMPVPSSYNDITQDAGLRDHVGWVWYDLEFYLSTSRFQKEDSVFIRIGSANYFASVWVNGQFATNHSGGYLPFQADVTSSLIYGGLNRITVAVNNTLTASTLPQGDVKFYNNSVKHPEGYFIQTYKFDFFNYAGIHRSVVLYSVPRIHIDDISITTSLTNDEKPIGLIRYDLSLNDGTLSSLLSGSLTLYDRERQPVKQISINSSSGVLVVENPHLWWPRSASNGSSTAYLYTLKIQIINGSQTVDSYRLQIGIRSLSWNDEGIYINSEKIYFKGFGRHEDSILRGRGLDFVTLTKDFNLMEWTGANSFRTSHYPYAEEVMDMADQKGFLVIDEVPAVSLSSFGVEVLNTHLDTLKELYQRDKNRASVVMWSVANEAVTTAPESEDYFRTVAQKTRDMDVTRPITFVTNQYVKLDLAAQFFDVICLNRYYGWYSDEGVLDSIGSTLTNDITEWKKTFGKPVIVTEYGADTITGLHQDPPFVWTEDFQLEFMNEYFNAFDKLYQSGSLIGEMIWNFADFATKQDIKRAVLNRKGVFTRERQPKASARLLKQRYDAIHSLSDF